MSRQVSRGSTGDYQADEHACVTRLSWRVSGRRDGRCRTAQLASISQMSRQVSRGSAGKLFLALALEEAGECVLYSRWSQTQREREGPVTKQKQEEIIRGPLTVLPSCG